MPFHHFLFNNIKRLSEKIYRIFYSASVAPLRTRINKKAFKKNLLEAQKEFASKKDLYSFSDYVMPQWQKNMHMIEDFFLNKFSFSFLHNKVIKRTMFVYSFKKWRDLQKILIISFFGKERATLLLRELNIGSPLLNDMQYTSSGNTIHHLYHIAKFCTETKTNLSQIHTIMEIGGGYGNFARLCKNIQPNITYFILDIPIFSFIQKVYLSTIFDGERVTIIDQPYKPFIQGGINLIPINSKTIDQIASKIGPIEMCVSTWALSESTPTMQKLVKNLNYFGANYLLLAYQKTTDTFEFSEEIKKVGSDFEVLYNDETEYTEDNYYLFAKRKQGIPKKFVISPS